MSVPVQLFAGTNGAVIDKELPEPIYQQIVRWMAAAIDAGQWPEHYKLPAEEDLARSLAVSRGTLRRAIQELIAAGRLKQIHGKGTFVTAGARVEQRLADQLITVSEELIANRIPFETVVLEQSVITPPQRVGSMLAVRPGEPVFFLKRLRKVGGRPLILFHNYIALERCPQIVDTDFASQRLFHVLEDTFHLKIDWGGRTLEAQVASTALAEQLGIRPGDPVLYLEQVVYLADGAPIEMSDVWFRGDSFRVTATTKRRGPATPRSARLTFVADPDFDDR